MERKIGEEFDYNGQKLKVLETAMGTCAGCVFMDNCDVDVCCDYLPLHIDNVRYDDYNKVVNISV